jgi:gluconate 5-dehydrogenase
VAQTLVANLDGRFTSPGRDARHEDAAARKIINICSLASEIGRPNIVPYATSKGGLQMLTRASAVRLAPFNVQVNGIAPGFFKTEMNAALIADAKFSAWSRRARRPGAGASRPKSPVLRYSSHPAPQITSPGTLFVDGGFSVAY